jgi:hypothetical protein
MEGGAPEARRTADRAEPTCGMIVQPPGEGMKFCHNVSEAKSPVDAIFARTKTRLCPRGIGKQCAEISLEKGPAWVALITLYASLAQSSDDRANPNIPQNAWRNSGAWHTRYSRNCMIR